MLSTRPTNPPFCTSSSTRTRSEVTKAISIPEKSAENAREINVMISQEVSTAGCCDFVSYNEMVVGNNRIPDIPQALWPRMEAKPCKNAFKSGQCVVTGFSMVPPGAGAAAGDTVAVGTVSLAGAPPRFPPPSDTKSPVGKIPEGFLIV